MTEDFLDELQNEADKEHINNIYLKSNLGLQ